MWAPGAGAGPGTGPGWNEWSLNPSHYANLPHEQVDWAALAQQWIQMKTGSSESELSRGPPPIPALHQFQPQHHQIQLNLHQPPPQPPPSLQQAQHSPQHPPHHHQLNSQPPQHHIPQLRQIHHTPPPPSLQLHWQSGGNSDFPTERFPPPLHLKSDNREDLSSHSHDAFSASSNSHDAIFPGHTINIHQPTGLRDGGHHWGGTGAPVPLPPTRDKFYASAHFNTETIDYNDDNVMSDQEAARRRSLPAWIREGLEKVEREKRKQEEKERLAMEKEAMRQAEAVDAAENSVETNKWNNTQGDSEDEGEEPSVTQDIAKFQVSNKLSKSEYDLRAVLGSMSEDERLEQTMMCVRRQLTKILLEVTTNEIEAVAQESMNRTKQKVISAAQVRKTGALASLTTGPLGLTEYGSGSDSDSAASDEESNHAESSDETSEAELVAEMEKKKRLFKLRELELGQSRQSSPKSRSASRSCSEARDIDKSEHRADKVEKTILSNEISDKPAIARGSTLSAIINSNISSSPLAETELKSKSVDRKENSSKTSNNRSRSGEKNRRKSRSHSKSRRRRNGSGKRHSKSRTPLRHRKSSGSRSRSTDRRNRRRNLSSSRERSTSNSRQRRSRSGSSRSSERRSRPSRRLKSRSRSISKQRRKRSRSRDRRRKRSYSSKSQGSSRDGSISTTKSKRKSRSRSRSISRERKKKKKTLRRTKSRSPSVSRRKQKSRSKSNERRRRKLSRRRRTRSRSTSTQRSRKYSSSEVGRSNSRARRKR